MNAGLRIFLIFGLVFGCCMFPPLKGFSLKSLQYQIKGKYGESKKSLLTQKFKTPKLWKKKNSFRGISNVGTRREILLAADTKMEGESYLYRNQSQAPDTRNFANLAKAGLDLFKPVQLPSKEKTHILNVEGVTPKTIGGLRIEHFNERKAQQVDPKGFVEGDMKMSPKLSQLMNAAKSQRREIFNYGKWSSSLDVNSNSQVVIAYIIDSSLSNQAQKAIHEAIKDYTSFTCIKLQKRVNEENYIKFHKGTGCWSYVGRQGGEQLISIGYGCGYKGTVIHEIMHALGFFHEHTRPDRDKYVKINNDNIISRFAPNFQKYNHHTVSDFDAPYDYYSIMHYNQYAFSKSIGEISIVPLDPKVKGSDLGQRSGFTQTDVDQIKVAYCEAPQTTSTASPTTQQTTSTASPTTQQTTSVASPTTQQTTSPASPTTQKTTKTTRKMIATQANPPLITTPIILQKTTNISSSLSSTKTVSTQPATTSVTQPTTTENPLSLPSAATTVKNTLQTSKKHESYFSSRNNHNYNNCFFSF